MITFGTGLSRLRLGFGYLIDWGKRAGKSRFGMQAGTQGVPKRTTRIEFVACFS
jgi:hypothetical protein